MLYRLAKSVLFRLDAETAHHLTVGGLSRAAHIPGTLALMRRMYGQEASPLLSQTLWGLEFANPVGLAAGLDKNGEAVPAFSSIGFGFVEVGTVTPRPQPGNDKPRLFRLPEDEALINRMGFNNIGIDGMAANLRAASAHRTVPVAVNIGKNKTTPNERAEDDYRQCLAALYPLADLFVVNISSPNTPDLRKLQHGGDLRRLLAAASAELARQAERHGGPPKPLLVKIAPDLSEDELRETVGIIADSGVSGIVATNTTVARPNLQSAHGGESGGLSGRPLFHKSTGIIRSIYRLTEGKLPIVGCGGIFSAEDAYEKIRAGASLVQLYTALIYRGPGLVREVNRGLGERLQRDGFTHISQAVGIDA